MVINTFYFNMEESGVINKEVLSKALTEKLNKNINIIKIEKAGGGYHSDGFKAVSADGQVFFVKKFKSYDLGFAFPERKVFSLMISDGMARRANQKPSPVGIMLTNKDKAGIIPEINEDTGIYHIQEFEPEGSDYFSLLLKRKNKAQIDEKDKEEIEKIVEYIKSIHSIKYEHSDQKRVREVYNDGIRSVLNSPELTLMLLHDFDEYSPIMDREMQKEYLGLMYEIMHRWKNREDRLCALHGDFWGANFFFRNDGTIWVVDYSRIPWGDPGIDVGWWLAQYLQFYYKTNNSYFKDLGELFINEYEKKTGDKEIRKTVTIALGLMGIIYVIPRFYPELDPKVGKRFLTHIMKILKEGELKWD